MGFKSKLSKTSFSFSSKESTFLMPKHQIFITRSKWVYIIQYNTVQYNGSNRNNVDFVVCWCVEFHCECVCVCVCLSTIYQLSFETDPFIYRNSLNSLLYVLPHILYFSVLVFIYFDSFIWNIVPYIYLGLMLWKIGTLRASSQPHITYFLDIKQLRDFIICFSLVQLWNCLLFLVHN